VKRLYLFSLAIFVISCSNPNKKEDMKNILNKMIKKQKTPSVQYLIAREDSILFEFDEGFSNLENKVLTDATKS